MKFIYSLKVCLAALVLILATTSSSFALIDGDIDGDGAVRMDDALLVLRYVAGTAVCSSPLLHIELSCPDLVTSCRSMAWDLYGRTSVCDITDVILILKRAQGLI